jgi:hypothetical protein
MIVIIARLAVWIYDLCKTLDFYYKKYNIVVQRCAQLENDLERIRRKHNS